MLCLRKHVARRKTRKWAPYIEEILAKNDDRLSYVLQAKWQSISL